MAEEFEHKKFFEYLRAHPTWENPLNHTQKHLGSEFEHFLKFYIY